MKNKETLEEAAKKSFGEIWASLTTEQSEYLKGYIDRQIDMAKRWQEERMHSEEELKLAYLAGYDMAKGISNITSKQFIQSLESKIDEVLSKETEESLTTWLDEKRSKQEQTLKEKLVIELNEYDYTGSSNDIYGMVVKVNGVEMPYHNLDTSTILEEVLEHLGYEVEIIETLDR
jgi:Ser-tRNA(Ala) deacylase AlaX